VKFDAGQVSVMLNETGVRDGPLHKRLSRGLRRLIDAGELPPRSLLPSERSLAAALCVSRTTVVMAYQALQEEGRLERRRGSGTRVRPPGSDGDRETVSSLALAGSHTSAQFLDGPLATVDLSTAALPGLPIVAEVAAGLGRSDYDALVTQHHGYHPRGLLPLRRRLACWYTDSGLPTTEDEILVTSGAQQALELIAKGCLQPDDGVLVEQPTYRGALEVFARSGCRLRNVPCDRDGLDVAAAEALAADRPLRLLYVQSTVHNPMGTVLSNGRRQRLLRLVQQQPSMILVDDTSLSGTQFEDAATPSLAADGAPERVIIIGSMSKLFWGGLRLGWIRASARVTSRLAQMKGLIDFGTSLVSQQIGLRLLDHTAEAKAIRRRQLARGMGELTALLDDLLPDWTWDAPSGGPSLWVRLPTGDATHFAPMALRYGVAILPGAVFSADGNTNDHIRLPYTLPANALSGGIHQLARAWQAYCQHGTVGVPPNSLTT
jgi:DNA-binding transcriptional MocR family regulator